MLSQCASNLRDAKCSHSCSSAYPVEFLISLSPQSNELDQGSCPVTTPFSVFTHAANTRCFWAHPALWCDGSGPRRPQVLLSCISQVYLSSCLTSLCVYLFDFETGPHCLAQAGLKPTLFLNSQKFSYLSLPSARTAGMSYSARLILFSDSIPCLTLFPLVLLL